MRLVKLNTEGEEIVAMPYFTSRCNQLVNPQDTTEQVAATKQTRFRLSSPLTSENRNGVTKYADFESLLYKVEEGCE